MEIVDEKILLFMIIVIFEFLSVQDKNIEAKSHSEITNNNLIFYTILLISLVAYLVMKNMVLKNGAELVIQMILYVITLV